MTDLIPREREPVALRAATGNNCAAPAGRSDMSTQRTRRLRAALDKAHDELTSARAAITTRVMRERKDEPLVVRRALAFAAVLTEIPIAIHADELLVGGISDRRRGAVFFPETRTTGIMLHSRWRTLAKRMLAVVLPPLLRAVGLVVPSVRIKSRQIGLLLSVELDDLETRDIQPFRIATAERDTLARQVLPYWRRRAAHRRYRTLLTPAQRHLQKEVAFTADNQFVGGVFLFSPGYQEAVRLGTDAVAARAETLGKEAVEGSPEADFYRAVATAQRAVGVLAERYAALAESLAGEAPSAERAAELRLIAATCRNVPRKGARTFREALQSFWFIYLAVLLDDGGMEVPFGRLDQLLWPYYQDDLAAGRIDAAAALEQFECFFVKASELTFVLENGANRVEDGNTGRLTLTLGGVDADGRDATNELSHLLVQTAANARTLQPNVSVRLHPDAPADFIERALAVVVSGSNNLQLFNDTAIVPALVKAGFTKADANHYIVTGCVQPAAADTYGSLCAAHVNGPRVLDLFLARQRREPESFAALFESFLAFLSAVLRETVGSLAHADRAHAELLPNPFLSGLMRGALERGRDVKSGGAYNNATGVNLMGLGTLTDSLAAIEDVVFSRKQLTLSELQRHLATDFAGAEVLRTRLARSTPSFGNGDQRADRIAAAIVAAAHAELAQHKTFRGGVHVFALHSEAGHVVMGATVGATPDGRKALAPLSVGAGPAHGRESQGPTAVLSSAARIDWSKVAGGSSLNLRFHPRTFSSRAQTERFRDMVLTYFFDQGGPHLQVNVVSTEELRRAQACPQDYHDLLVRISGYSARFVELSRETQEEIISRVEHGA